MKIKFLSSLLLCGMLAFVSGCVDTIDGHVKAGVPTKDTIVKRFDRSLPQVQLAARAVLNHVGKLQVDNIVANTLEAKVNERTVWVRVLEIEPKLTQVSVQARNGMAADIELAADISTQIALQLVNIP